MPVPVERIGVGKKFFVMSCLSERCVVLRRSERPNATCGDWAYDGGEVSVSLAPVGASVLDGVFARPMKTPGRRRERRRERRQGPHCGIHTGTNRAVMGCNFT